ncbi:branched-chain amino acid ABC transporter ATP-binding protein/permease [Herbiconiux sp. CPCC 203407]|uniref:Branched-chain amino acid ABC transporter ATP-binding protein/permease n=1 Tax=Herbiconiux oxytropis TaxID=2970915 RepID=A0AA42BWJ9_9MICO|nr:branched-chain amino acid ABC transporter ATP-binding protein/permease [Herbiconiux oxytropis]MCS5722633.1 branched-chain amino acid ABC transporter ATP-binding protein/permease [Herbiconiux oxytropis]MCS5726353.1 branched-chain amino acid ABC transporter ATP-binding protein/permease [Herbiconiux oxytropis]
MIVKSSWALPRLTRLAIPAVLALVAVLLPFILPGDRWVRVAALALIYIALASGLNILVGLTGLLDLGFIAFFIVGAYTTAILTVQLFVNQLGFDPDTLWWLFPVSLVGALVLAGIAGCILGYPTLRARGDYLAIMTLAFGEIVRLVSINWIGLTGGSVGIRGIPPFAIGDLELTSPSANYYVVLAMVVVILVALAGVVASPVGRAWVAIREDELVASSMGIRTRRYKLLAYVCGASIAGVTGVFFAHMQQFINPDSFTLEDNFIVLSLVILGGAGTFWGPVVGATLWIFFQAIARDWTIVQEHPEFRTGFLALIVVVLMIVRPGGIVSRKLKLTRSGGDVERPEPRTAPAGLEPDPIEAGAPVLVVDTVGRTFGGLTALGSVSFEVRRGEILGLMGPNGAGKSTLLNVLSGVTKPSRGSITFRGDRIDGLDSDRVSVKGVARTFQTVRLFWQMTVLENLLVGAHERLRGWVPAFALRLPRHRHDEARALTEAGSVLEFAGVWDERTRRASALSYDSQRRVEIARALMTRPKLLLLDEPAAGMNESETKALASLITAIRDSGTDVVLIEHDMDLLMSVSDRIVVLDHGEVIATGTPDEVRRNPAVLEAYLGSDA